MVELTRCVVCGAERVDKAHIYPRDTHPELKDLKLNIIPLCRAHHRAFDKIYDIIHRLYFIRPYLGGNHMERLVQEKAIIQSNKFREESANIR